MKDTQRFVVALRPLPCFLLCFKILLLLPFGNRYCSCQSVVVFRYKYCSTSVVPLLGNRVDSPKNHDILRCKGIPCARERLSKIGVGAADALASKRGATIGAFCCSCLVVCFCCHHQMQSRAKIARRFQIKSVHKFAVPKCKNYY